MPQGPNQNNHTDSDSTKAQDEHVQVEPKGQSVIKSSIKSINFTSVSSLMKLAFFKRRWSYQEDWRKTEDSKRSSLKTRSVLNFACNFSLPLTVGMKKKGFEKIQQPKNLSLNQHAVPWDAAARPQTKPCLFYVHCSTVSRRKCSPTSPCSHCR